MLKIKCVPVLARIIGKIDLKPIVKSLKEADIFKEVKNKKDAIEQFTDEKIVELGFEILPAIAPQIGAIGEDIPELVALYYDISVEEASEKDLLAVFNDFIHDKGIRGFFDTALRKKAEREV